MLILNQNKGGAEMECKVFTVTLPRDKGYGTTAKFLEDKIKECIASTERLADARNFKSFQVHVMEMPNGINDGDFALIIFYETK